MIILNMEFAGFPTGSIENGALRIDYLRQGGLRLVGLTLGESGSNLLVELPDVGWQTPNGYYRLFGGHRLWVAPESQGITYLPEPEEIHEERIPGGVRLAQATDERSGLQKIMEVSLAPGKAAFTIRHSLVNQGEKKIRAAAWAISQFRLGGIAAVPQPATWADEAGLLPNRSLALWPYTRLNDPRLCWMEHYLMIRTQRIEQPCKVGYTHPVGWIAYLLDGVLIRKQVVIQAEWQYPDMNSALEIYVNHRFIELESLSPLVVLKPGERIFHEERWSLEETDGLKDEQALADYLS